MLYRTKIKKSLDTFFVSWRFASRRVVVWGYIYPPHTATQKHTRNAVTTAIQECLESAVDAGVRECRSVAQRVRNAATQKTRCEGVAVFFATPYAEFTETQKRRQK